MSVVSDKEKSSTFSWLKKFNDPVLVQWVMTDFIVHLCLTD